MIGILNIAIFTMVTILALDQGSLAVPEIFTYLENAVQHKIENISVAQYKESESGQEVTKCYRFYKEIGENAAHKMHALDIWIENSGSAIDVKFSQHKKNEFTLHMTAFFEHEWNAMNASVNTLIGEIINVKDDEFRKVTIYFNTFQDIRNALVAKLKAISDVGIDYMAEEHKSILNVRSMESQLANASFEVVNVQQNDNGQQDIAVKQIIKVIITPSLHESEPVEIVFDIITLNNKDFDLKISAIVEAMKLKGFFNNNKENYNIVKSFFKKHIGVEFDKSRENGVNENEINLNREFKAPFENSYFIGSVEYIAPTDKVPIGTYKLTVSLDNTEIINQEYHRMKDDDLIKKLQSLNLKQFMRSIKDQIFDSFEAHIRDSFGSKFKDIIFAISSSMFKKDNIKTATSGVIKLGDINYGDDKNIANFVLTMNQASSIVFEYSFKKAKYQKEIVDANIEVIIANAASKVKTESA